MGFGFLLTVQGCANAVQLCENYGDFEYREENGAVFLAVDEGEVQMRFSENSVKIYESYRYDSAVYEIVAFVRQYSEEKDYGISRENAELVGEFKLHNWLYSIGYKREQTQHSDIEYTADSRWYVNWASKFIGWFGV